MTLVVGLLHGATFLSNHPLVLFVSFIGPQQLGRTPIKSEYNNNIILFDLLCPLVFSNALQVIQSFIQL